MKNSQSSPRFYPMKRRWQIINGVFGFWSWGMAFVSYSLAIILQWGWGQKVLPAFRKLMAGPAESYLRVSAQGLEYRKWPWYEYCCGWDDISHLKSGRWLGDVLYLKRAEQQGYLEFTIRLGQPQIHLSSLVGWSDGQLAADLRQNAPQLFD